MLTVFVKGTMIPLKAPFSNLSHTLHMSVRNLELEMADSQTTDREITGRQTVSNRERETIVVRRLDPSEVKAALPIRMASSVGIEAPKLRPKSIYMDGLTPVELPEEEDDPITGCPPSWRALFTLHKRQGKFPYMYGKLMREEGEVGDAFRSLMTFVFDRDGNP